MLHITEVDGVKVVACEPAQGPHPNTTIGGMVTYRTLLHVLLEDGRELYGCGKCGQTFDSLTGARGHQKIHSDKVPHDYVPDGEKLEAIKAALRAVKKYTNLTDRYARAAVELNASGKRTVSGKEWTPDSVGRVWRTYGDRITVRTPKTRSDATQAPRESVTGQVSDTEQLSIPATSHITELAQRVSIALTAGDRLAATLREAHNIITSELITELVVIQQLINSGQLEVTDPEIAEKARKFDELRGMLS